MTSPSPFGRRYALKQLNLHDRLACIMHGIITAALIGGLLWNAPQLVRVAHLYATGAVSPPLTIHLFKP